MKVVVAGRVGTAGWTDVDPMMLSSCNSGGRAGGAGLLHKGVFIGIQYVIQCCVSVFKIEVTF